MPSTLPPCSMLIMAWCSSVFRSCTFNQNEDAKKENYSQKAKQFFQISESSYTPDGKLPKQHEDSKQRQTIQSFSRKGKESTLRKKEIKRNREMEEMQLFITPIPLRGSHLSGVSGDQMYTDLQKQSKINKSVRNLCPATEETQSQ